MDSNPKYVPHNKGKKGCQLTGLPGKYKRLSPEMTELVDNPPSASERKEMVLRTGSYHLLRPRQGVLKSDMETQQDQTSEQ